MRKLFFSAALCIFSLSATSVNAQKSFLTNSTGVYLPSPYTLNLGGSSSSDILFNVQMPIGKEINYFLSFSDDKREGTGEVLRINKDAQMEMLSKNAAISLWQYSPDDSNGMAGHFSITYSENYNSYTISSIGGGLPASLTYNASEHIFRGDINAQGKIKCVGEFEVTEVNTDNIYTKDVQFKMNNVADYVFEKDYNLKNLSEIEEFVNENKHLPGVPSAKEIETNGVSMSKMTNILLEKIEELTLHMIHLEKENKELKSEIESLKK